MGTWVLSQRAVEVTTHLQLTTKLGMIGAVLLLPSYVFMALTVTPLPLLHMAEMVLDCVRSVETWERRRSSQQPTRPAYGKFEAVKCQQSHNQAIFFSHHPDSVDINFTFCKAFQIRWQQDCRKLNPLQNIVHFTVGRWRPIAVLDWIASVTFLQSDPTERLRRKIEEQTQKKNSFQFRRHTRKFQTLPHCQTGLLGSSQMT